MVSVGWVGGWLGGRDEVVGHPFNFYFNSNQMLSPIVLFSKLEALIVTIPVA